MAHTLDEFAGDVLRRQQPRNRHLEPQRNLAAVEVDNPQSLTVEACVYDPIQEDIELGVRIDCGSPEIQITRLVDVEFEVNDATGLVEPDLPAHAAANRLVLAVRKLTDAVVCDSPARRPAAAQGRGEPIAG